MIQLTGLTKRFGNAVAVDRVSLSLHPGAITGFLGPNGAGKTTTMRMILGLAAPTSGHALIAGRPYASLEQPWSKIGAMMDANAIDTRLTPRQHLTVLATGAGIPKQRVDALLLLTGLQQFAHKKIGELSFGMRQRVCIAGALIGDPDAVMMDEPFNGLDVEGIRWLRTLLRNLARQGKAVLVSSHLLSEVQEIADRVIVLARGELIADMGMDQLREQSLRAYVQVRSDKQPELKKLLLQGGAQVEAPEAQLLHVRNASIRDIGDLAFTNGIRIYELVNHQPTLEQLFSELVGRNADDAGRSPRLNREEAEQ